MTVIPLLLIGPLCACPALGAETGASHRDTATRLRDAIDELDVLEKDDDAVAAQGEISVARQWAKEGMSFLKEGRAREAAIRAERLPGQLRLIRALLGMARVRREVEEAGARADDLSRRIEGLRTRYQRLVVERDGPHATLAYPRATGAGSDE